MITVKEGCKELRKAFDVYRCTFCGFEGIVALEGARPYGYMGDGGYDENAFAEDLFEGPETEESFGFTRHICPCCGMGMDKIKFTMNANYVAYLKDTKVKLHLWNDFYEDYLLHEDDLYLRT